MSLKRWLQHTISIEKNMPTLDSSGGQVDSWATCVYDSATGATTEDLPANFWHVAGSGSVDLVSNFGRPEGTGVHAFCLDRDVSAGVGYRVLMGSTYYQVVGIGENWIHPGMTERPYLIYAIERQYS